MSTTIALIAHDSQREELVSFVEENTVALSFYELIAPERTAQYLLQGTGVEVQVLSSLHHGGDIELAYRILQETEIAAVIFFLDPGFNLSSPEIQVLIRACNLQNVPLATNRATARAMLSGLTRSRSACLIFNPVSGTGNSQQDLVLIRQLLEPHIYLKVSFTTPTISAEQLAQEAVESGVDIVIASGGDGTVSAVAGAVMGTDIPLGIIPRGTANAFCMAMGIPGNIRGACNNIIAGLIRTVDIATCNARPMILLAGIGYEAETIDKADRETKQRWGALAYIMAGLQQLDEQVLFDTEIEIDGTISRVRSGAVTIANAAPATSILAQGLGEVIPNDGKLEVLIFAANQNENQKFTKVRAIAGMVELFGSALLKTGTQRDHMIGLRATNVKVKTEPPQKVVLDGEIIGTTPIEIQCIPNGLKILAPSVIPQTSDQNTETSEKAES
ncbi:MULTISPECIES: methylglyoxal synthase [Limnospira]|uniref:Diacylglycerol kinase catalytic region n=1 Tax=Limnospira maxima CS-328 TaxID=513049 RepID=B5VUE7_LIMMA|nr:MULTISPECIES: methylglyoxal synthase [Limnospira]MDC0839813.1 methylglyoxal synthase [Limnoraphis robusta]QJB28397.1 methylglyoxal synthase [Limnospira fusiformis SAG 85.79]EDZ97163.1 diacylglycerol kinase catalytic region [Limnospira maxima CS-328]MDT9190249.1 methylglyoxal synthase [Limnospira sp. PMC 894.15]QNH58281.1 MAG: methylglyoxal synthase [Limnospira indica BM01]